RQKNGDPSAKRDISVMRLAGIRDVDEIPFACQPAKAEAKGHGKDKGQKRDPGKTRHVSSKACAKGRVQKIELGKFLRIATRVHDLALERAAYSFQVGC